MATSPLPACPACGHALLRPRPLHALTVDACERCHGLWFDAGELEAHLHAARAGATAPEGAPADPTAAPSPARRAGPAFRACPRCAKLMTPRAWEKHSGVVVDTCAAHGAWLDGAELAALEAWVRSPRAARKAREAEAETRAAEERAADGLPDPAAAAFEAYGTDRTARSVAVAGPTFAEAVGEALWALLDLAW